MGGSELGAWTRSRGAAALTAVLVLLTALLAGPSNALESGGVANGTAKATAILASILVIEHDMPLLSSICDRLIALELGQVIATGAPAEVLEHPRVVESYLGTELAAIQRSGTLTTT